MIAWLHDAAFWIALIMALGGMFVAMGGMLWEKAARVLRFFEVEANPALGFKLFLAGIAVSVIGFGWIYLFR